MTMQSVETRIEHVDTDAAGVVHFTRYSSLLETAVLENLERLGIGLSALAGDDCSLVVVESRMRYHASARFLDRVRTEVTADHVGPASIRMSGTVHGTAGPLATGTLVLGVVDTSGQPTAVPGRLATALKELSA